MNPCITSVLDSLNSKRINFNFGGQIGTIKIQLSYITLTRTEIIQDGRHDHSISTSFLKNDILEKIQNRMLHIAQYPL